MLFVVLCNHNDLYLYSLSVFKLIILSFIIIIIMIITDVEKFLTVTQSSQKLQKHGLSARPLEAADSVRVESLPPTVVKGSV